MDNKNMELRIVIKGDISQFILLLWNLFWNYMEKIHERETSL